MRFNHSLFLCCFIIVSFAFPKTTVAESYSIMALEAASGQSACAAAINQNGDVSGTIFDASGLPPPYSRNPQFFIYTDGKLNTFSAPGSIHAILSINAHVEVFGTICLNPRSEAPPHRKFYFRAG